jgi:hypothetical protein
MRKTILGLAAVCFMAVCVSDAQAWIFGKKKEAATQTPAMEQPASSQAQKPAAPKADPQKAKSDKALEDALKLRKAAQDKKRSELNNTEWQIELNPMSGKGKKESETVIFKDNKISFLNFGKKGFPVTNYSITVQEDGSFIWETMQTSEKSGMAFWRGEMDSKAQRINGVLSHQIDAKTKQDYSFVSTSRRAIEPAGK